MASNNDINIIVDPLDNFFKKIGDNFDEVRGCSLALSVYCPRTPSLSSSDCNEDYTTRMQKESDRMDEDNPVATSNSIQLKYITPKSQDGQFSKMANSSKVAGQQCVANKKPVLNINPVKIEESRLDLFYFSFHFFYFSFQFIFQFSIFRITRVRVDPSHCHISHNLMA